MSKYTFFDLFGGIGGFRIGMERAGFKCVGYCDNDKHSSNLYRSYFDTREEKHFKDATTIDTKDLPDFDVLCGGFPCQPFSVAGVRQGFKDKRGQLIFDVARILRHSRPRYFVLENVRGLLNHQKGETFLEIVKILTDIGYTVSWQLCNSKHFGVPQSRERVFIVGHLREKSGREILPLTNCGESDISKIKRYSITKGNAQGNRIYNIDGLSPCLTANGGGQGGKCGLYFINKPRFNLYKKSKIVQTLKVGGDTPLTCRAIITPAREKKRQNGRRYKENEESMFTLTAQDQHGVILSEPFKIKEATKKGYAEAEVGDGINLSFPESKTRRGRVCKNGSQTLETSCNIGTVDKLRIRRLTPLECFRLQGFPDEMIDTARTLKLSDSRLYKMAGNAVTVNVVEAIAHKLMRKFEEVENG